MTSLPTDFIAEAERARANRDAAKLILLRLETAVMDWAQEAAPLVALPEEWEHENFDRLLLFTGHRIDSKDRETPRFPASAEPIARSAIKEVVKLEKSKTQGTVFGVAGGANGGDILFLECCRDEAVATEMLLAVPPEQFIPASVEADTGEWVDRFNRLLKEGSSAILARDETLPQWLSSKPGYDIWQRNNLWLLAYALSCKPAKLILVALWDGKGGDGPGGTEHMVQMARQQGAEVVHLDTREFFGR